MGESNIYREGFAYLIRDNGGAGKIQLVKIRQSTKMCYHVEYANKLEWVLKAEFENQWDQIEELDINSV